MNRDVSFWPLCALCEVVKKLVIEFDGLACSRRELLALSTDLQVVVVFSYEILNVLQVFFICRAISIPSDAVGHVVFDNLSLNLSHRYLFSL